MSNVKVRFYELDKQNFQRGKSLGTAEFKEGKLTVEICDLKFKQFLDNPFTTMADKIKVGIKHDWLVTYEPGTIEHIKAIAAHCHRFGYLSEIVKD